MSGSIYLLEKNKKKITNASFYHSSGLPLKHNHIEIDFNKDIKVKGQFNYLLAGRQTSYLSDIAGFTDIENKQSSGWGVDFTVDYNLTDKTSLYSFYRHWDIDKSDTANGTFAGVLIFQAFEPANTTTEAGIGIAFKF